VLIVSLRLFSFRRRVGVIHVKPVQHPVGNGREKDAHQAYKYQAAENGVCGGEQLGRRRRQFRYGSHEELVAELLHVFIDFLAEMVQEMIHLLALFLFFGLYEAIKEDCPRS
jgi:hypothetical protein